MEDQQPGSGDLTTEDTSAAESSRRGFFRRRAKVTPPVVETAADTPDTADAATPTAEAPKTPMGKSARSARARTVEQEVDSPHEADPVVNTAEAAPEGEVATEAAEADVEAGEDAEVEEAEDAEAAVDTEAAVEAEPVVLVPHRPVGKGLIITAAAASVLFVGASAFAGAMVQPYLSERALVATKLDIARTATDAIRTLWTYTPDDMTTLADRASAYLGGDFADEYRRYIDAIVEPNKQAQVTNSTEVIGAAVESVAPPSIPTEATALVYTNSVATGPVTKNIPALRYLSYRLTMQREDGEWRITRMSTITSFDLTPQL